MHFCNDVFNYSISVNRYFGKFCKRTKVKVTVVQPIFCSWFMHNGVSSVKNGDNFHMWVLVSTTQSIHCKISCAIKCIVRECFKNWWPIHKKSQWDWSFIIMLNNIFMFTLMFMIYSSNRLQTFRAKIVAKQRKNAVAVQSQSKF